jgi:predicted nucleotidyltransferase
MALASGIDVVIENPLPFATASAESFALSAVILLDAAGATHMSFGAESGDLHLLRQIAEACIQNAAPAKKEFKRLMSQGLPYHTAKEYSHYILRQYHDIISKPNHILAIEYLKSMQMIKSRMQPVAVRRSNNESSTSIRKKIIIDSGAIMNGGFAGTAAAYDMPTHVFDILRDALRSYGAACISRLDDVLFYLLSAKDLGYIKAISGMNDGLAERFVGLAPLFNNSADLFAAVKTKRHTYARLKRTALSLLLGITAQERTRYITPLYLRVLGFRNADALRHLMDHATLPVVVNISKVDNLSAEARYMLDMELHSTNVYNICREKKKDIVNEEYRQKIIKN